MQLSSLLAVALAGFAAVEAHTIFQKVSVNGQEQGQLKGVRAPASNYPIENVNHPDFACNTGINYKDNTVINIPAGARVGAWWGHEIGGANGPNDLDHPIAASHKGPVIVYLAKVDNAASASAQGQKWFKIAEDGLSGGKWAVDRLIENGGWTYFNIPTCVAPGNYLMRVEIIALHNAPRQGGAQFYMECAQINVTGGGSNNGQSNTVSFPGGYSATHPGILTSIYDQNGGTNSKPYTIPGPAVLQCSGNDNTPAPQPTTSQGGSQPTQPPATGGGTVAKWGQCGGIGYSGATGCVSGSTCTKINDYYSQCT
ncbi:hypothetical protein BJ508DRAFT_416250 [Ascobolus immersus RN42]|uniref:AA9 family lytic polysaccharide monooxygenase n=1 Tax=Ascobolus immersus RN42 TaxID=1160509 RepID=A0A3N4I2J9_ASCIM|nr:hypothetical protein BJ508DRAFT_416250 [Ascobolus immersus RN42]